MFLLGDSTQFLPTVLYKKSCVFLAIKLLNKTGTKKIREDFRK
jgi:hypothetical protein